MALARALINRPAALLLDEPLGALDLKLRKEMQLELKRIQKETGTTFVYVTHDQEEALTMSDRIAVMSGGRRASRSTRRGSSTSARPPPSSRTSSASPTSIGMRVERRDDGLVAMDLGDGMCLQAPDPGGAIGAELTLVVRPEKIKLNPEQAPDGCRVRGRLREQVYLGSVTALIVELQTGDSLVVHTLNDDAAGRAGPRRRARARLGGASTAYVIGSGAAKTAGTEVQAA